MWPNLAQPQVHGMAESRSRFLGATGLGWAPSPRAAFQQYAQQRTGQVRYYATLSHWLTPFFQSNGPLLGLGRDLALPMMTAIPPIRRQMELAMTGVKTGWLSPDYAV